MSDLLAADSLLLTILAVLYSVWYTEIDTELRRTADPLPKNNTDAYKRMKRVFVQRALPLTVAALAVTAVFLPEAIDAAVPVVRRAVHGHRPAHYNAVSTAFFVVTLGTLGLALHLGVRSYKLWMHRGAFDPDLPAPVLNRTPAP